MLHFGAVQRDAVGPDLSEMQFSVFTVAAELMCMQEHFLYYISYSYLKLEEKLTICALN